MLTLILFIFDLCHLIALHTFSRVCKLFSSLSCIFSRKLYFVNLQKYEDIMKNLGCHPFIKWLTWKEAKNTLLETHFIVRFHIEQNIMYNIYNFQKERMLLSAIAGMPPYGELGQVTMEAFEDSAVWEAWNQSSQRKEKIKWRRKTDMGFDLMRKEDS